MMDSFTSEDFSLPNIVKKDPVLFDLYTSRSCFTCGRLPSKPYLVFNFCSLCRDPAAGRFCCKDPCFKKAWKKGHKEVCAGRDKGKDKKKGPGGSGPDPSSALSDQLGGLAL
jgi:hypothetical protein